MIDRLNELTQAAANHLAGQPVIIRWRYPAAEAAAGQCYKTASGQVVIDIAPFDSAEKKYGIFLHELAHARLGHAVYTGAVTKPPASIPRSDPQRAAWREDPREKAANELAAKWVKYGEKNAWRYMPELPPLEANLRALLDWRE